MRKSIVLEHLKKLEKATRVLAKTDWDKVEKIFVEGNKELLKKASELGIEFVLCEEEDEENGLRILYVIREDGSPAKIIVRQKVEDFISYIEDVDSYVSYLEDKIGDRLETSHVDKIHSSMVARDLDRVLYYMLDVCVKAHLMYDISPEDAERLDRFAEVVEKFAKVLREEVRENLRSYAFQVAVGWIKDDRWKKLVEKSKEKKKRD